jgi:hypothetical protein
MLGYVMSICECSHLMQLRLSQMNSCKLRRDGNSLNQTEYPCLIRSIWDCGCSNCSLYYYFFGVNETSGASISYTSAQRNELGENLKFLHEARWYNGQTLVLFRVEMSGSNWQSAWMVAAFGRERLLLPKPYCNHD